jgi:hypothetical protein
LGTCKGERFDVEEFKEEGAVGAGWRRIVIDREVFYRGSICVSVSGVV